jgi:ATP-binding cassette, subfamily B, bacterial PglK
MFKDLVRLSSIFGRAEKIRLFKIQILLIYMALAETFSVLSITPFMVLVAEGEFAESSLYASVFEYFDLDSYQELVFLLGSLTIGFIAAASATTALAFRNVLVVGQSVGAKLSSDLYDNYIMKSWKFHLKTNGAALTNNIIVESDRVTQFLLMGLLLVISKTLIAIGMIIVMFLADPKAALWGVMGFSLIYLLVFQFLKLRLINSGQRLSEFNELRLRLLTEGFGGIKELKLSDRTHFYKEKFRAASFTRGRLYAANSSYELLPRYFIEFVAFSGLILLVLGMMRSNETNSLAEIMPSISLFGLAIMKLLPAFQGIYGSIASLKIHMGAFLRIEGDLKQVRFAGNILGAQDKSLDEQAMTVGEIVFEDVSFSYHQDENKNALTNISFNLPERSSLGLVGSSGSGKSTLSDIMMGFHQPDKGKVMFGGKVIAKNNRKSFQKNIGYVAQAVYLADTSIKNNIAFGIDDDEIDEDQITQVSRMANLHDFVMSLPDRYESKVGDRGVQISGGQKQRIAIARALYSNPEILIFDEATSALDTVTESIVMDTIRALSGEKTIVLIAHRLSTVELCDNILVLDNGRIESQGTFEELKTKSKSFSKMLNNH